MLRIYAARESDNQKVVDSQIANYVDNNSCETLPLESPNSQSISHFPS
jgi:hypothetical protein